MVVVDAPTLLSALTRFPAVTRETLSHVIISRRSAMAMLVPDADYGSPRSGQLTHQVALLEQLRALDECRLWGEVIWAPEGDEDDLRVQLWAGAGEREAWRKRLMLAARGPQALAALEAGGDVKLAAWRREHAMTRLRAPVHAATAAGVRPTDLIALTQVARSTLYAMLKDEALEGERPAGWSRGLLGGAGRSPREHGGPPRRGATTAAAARHGWPDLAGTDAGPSGTTAREPGRTREDALGPHCPLRRVRHARHDHDGPGPGARR